MFLFGEGVKNIKGSGTFLKTFVVGDITFFFETGGGGLLTILFPFSSIAQFLLGSELCGL